MSQSSLNESASNAAAEASTRFLVELENTWTLQRLYGTEHPAFRRGAESAAAAIDRPTRVAISPRGFSPVKAGAPNETLGVFAQRLRAMGLVGLTMEPGLTPAQIVALVGVLIEADRSRVDVEAVVEKIAAATGGRVNAVPLRLDNLRLVEGTGGGESDQKGDVWQDLFASAFAPGTDPAASSQLAQAFETALRRQSSGQWDAMVGAWMKQLAAIDSNGVNPASVGPGRPAHPNTQSVPLDSVAAFLGTLSPTLCQRLLKETITEQEVSTPVVIALAERLPAGVVLGALASVDRTNGAPSTAALALLRKMSANVVDPSRPPDAVPTTHAELADASATLERLLMTSAEHQFVPEEYLQRRQELSHHALSPAQGQSINYPAPEETTRHAAGLAFDILAAPEAEVSELTAALTFVTDRVGTWVRAGEFSLACESITRCAALAGHPEAAVSKAAQAIMAASLNADDLHEGSTRRSDRARAIDEVAELLCRSDGSTLAAILTATRPESGDPVFEALRRVMPALLPEKSLETIFRSLASCVPPSLLGVLTSLKEADAVKAVAAIVPHASGPVRRAAVHVIFRRDFRWTPALTDQLLRDEEPEIRRLAVMKLVSDCDLKTAAGVLAAATKPGKYEADVALGLAELLRRHRRHPDVRPAWKTWAWSKRWWIALLFVDIGTARRAA